MLDSPYTTAVLFSCAFGGAIGGFVAGTVSGWRTFRTFTHTIFCALAGALGGVVYLSLA